MNITDQVSFNGILKRSDIPPEMRPVLEELVGRIEAFRKNLIDQLNRTDADEVFSIDAVEHDTGDAVVVHFTPGNNTIER